MMNEAQLRIVVADDETMQRNVLTEIIHKLYPFFEVISCSNGKEVYDILTNKPVDIVLTDIRMPVMGGMELIKKVYNEFPRTKIILISAYQEFEYAQNAIKYKVVEYLIKPFRVSEVQKLLQKVQMEIQKESENEKSLNQYQLLANEVKKREEQKILQDVLEGNTDIIKSKQEKYLILQEFGTVALIRWRGETADLNNYPNQLTRQQQCTLMEHISFLFPHMFLIPQPNDFEKSVHKAALLLPKETAMEVSQKLEYCLKQLRQNNIIFWAGLSNTKLNLAASAAEALTQAEEMLAFYFYETGGGVFSFDKMHTIMDIPTKSTVSFENQLHRAIRGSDIKQVYNIIDDMKKALSNETRCYPNKIKHRVSSMIVLILKELENKMIQEQYDQLLNRSYQMYAECDSFDKLFEISKQLLEQAVQYSMQNTIHADVVEECITYIKSHLDSDLSLQKVAEYIHFHPNYLSGKLKEKVGLPYSVFVLKLRMELASSLLMDTNDKIQDISLRCGFNDSNYFNRMFRREYHISPEQYRKAHKKW
ncbi:response regulator transcription factor [Anaerocolumna sp. MB42-C2]|uniref:response regulator transcription factor n=1 Tax=Anaerocolumna sp. MB42-C2 TaxID=3070997 RepID=UPI0027E072F9|nr:response regulator [Anaerocolumna sp. MB42-C2]WMJ87079.1 response regulator [Anaerocolumna sp. MB42-C2]